MLILTRKIGESIQVGDDVRIKIIDVGRHFVKVGIEAPPEIKVHREEIYERIREENILAGRVGEVGLSEAARLLKQKKPAESKPRRIIIRKKKSDGEQE